MKKQVLPILLLATLLAACATKPQSVPSQPAPVSVQPQPEPPKPAEPEKPKVDPIQAMGWYESDIGYPMKSDDPKAAGLRVAMLTFDDGPTKTITPQILDVLKKEKIRAIFFVTGYGIEGAPDMLKRAAAEGHIIGVHTMTHPDLSKMSKDEQRKEIEPLIKIIVDQTGQRPKYIRPPFGSYNQDTLDLAKELGLTVTTWSNGSLDWDGLDKDGHKDPQKVIDSVMEQLGPGSNILMHDIHQHTAEALPKLIQTLRSQGYQFVTLGKE